MKSASLKVLAAIGLVAIGCSSSSTTAPSPSTTAGTPTEPAAEAQGDPAAEEAPVCEAALAGACGDCMKASCCDALSACEADANCQACVTGKDSDACEKTNATHARVNAYLVCKGGACKAPCIGAPGGACADLTKGIVEDVCQSCLEAKCCDEVAACHSKDVCWDGCLTNHDETKCHGDPDAHAAYHAFGQCLTSKCSAECN